MGPLRSPLDKKSLKQQHGKIRLYYLYFALAAVVFILYVLKSKQRNSIARPLLTVGLSPDNLIRTDATAATTVQHTSPTALQQAFARAGHHDSATAEQQDLLLLPAAVPQPMSLDEAVQKPVIVHFLSGHFFGPTYERTVPDCSYQGRPITCIWGRKDTDRDRQTTDSDRRAADVLWQHGCPTPVRKSRPDQLTVIMYMESAEYYPCLNSAEGMDQFDIEMTYRLCSHVITHYFDFTHETVQKKLFAPPEPFESKKDAVAFVNSNCNPLSGRDKMVQALMDTGKIPVHAHGSCLNNQPRNGSFSKIELFRGYKFCVAIENSISKDYMTEKLWNAFTAGCVPIYLGPPNVKDFLPADGSIVLWSDFANADAVADELVRLMHNKTAYEEKLRWKHFKTITELNLGLRQLMGTDVAPKFHSQCQICQLVVGNRITPKVFKGTHCMRNASWLDNAATSWTPEAAGYAKITDAVDFHLPG